MKTVAVIFGGRSTEHDISVITALASVIKPLILSKKYEVLPIYITKHGTWYADVRLGEIELFSQGTIQSLLAKLSPIQLDINGHFSVVWPGGGLRSAKQRKIDIVFPAMHGMFGEDGDLMGLLEMACVPYVGCNVPSSVVAMDKVLAKQVTAADGIASTPWQWCTGREAVGQVDSVVANATAQLSWPIFVKPAHLGSSIGITRVANELELRNALEVAAHYDDKIIIEQGVANLIEVTLPIMGNETLTPALLEQPLTSSEDFFDFETKYMHGGKKGGKNGTGKTTGAQGYSNLPAKLPDHLYKKAEQLGLAVYRSLGCTGTARVDMLIDSETEEVYFNEVNPLPGDLYRHNWRQAGVSGVELVDKLISLAEERFATTNAKTTTFSTSFLKQF